MDLTTLMANALIFNKSKNQIRVTFIAGATLQNFHYSGLICKAGETDQASELGCFPADRDKIWCVKAPWVDVESY